LNRDTILIKIITLKNNGLLDFGKLEAKIWLVFKNNQEINTLYSFV